MINPKNSSIFYPFQSRTRGCFTSFFFRSYLLFKQQHFCLKTNCGADNCLEYKSHTDLLKACTNRRNQDKLIVREILTKMTIYRFYGSWFHTRTSKQPFEFAKQIKSILFNIFSCTVYLRWINLYCYWRVLYSDHNHAKFGSSVCRWQLCHWMLTWKFCLTQQKITIILEQNSVSEFGPEDR